MTRDEWHRERMEQERNEDAQVEAREDAEMFYEFACAKILADAFHEMLMALCEPDDDEGMTVTYPKGSDGAW
jgi:hypothetical protein